MEGTMPIASVENERLRFWVDRKCLQWKLLLILNRLCSYWNGPYSQEEYSKFVIWNRFEWHKEQYQMQTSKINHISSNIRKCHTSKLFIILKQMSSYLYGTYSQTHYSNFSNWNRFEIWNERWQVRTSKKNVSAPQKFIKFTRLRCSYFLTKWGPSDMDFIPSMSKTGFPSEIDFKSRSHKIRCELEKNGTAL
jgi:hypothetical protein